MKLVLLVISVLLSSLVTAQTADVSPSQFAVGIIENVGTLSAACENYRMQIDTLQKVNATLRVEIDKLKSKDAQPEVKPNEKP